MSVSLYCIVFLSIFVAFSQASHGRYGSITFTKSATDARLVNFNANLVYRRSYFGAPNVGDVVYDIALCYGDGSSCDGIPMTVNAVNLNDDWIAVTYNGNHQYAAAGNYRAEISSCCRIFELNNNPSGSYSYTAQVVITAAEVGGAAANNSPVSGSLPIINVPYNVVPYSYQLTATDPDSDALTFSMAPDALYGGGNAPPGLSVSASGLVTITTALAKGYWQTQQVITDTFGNYIVVDYLILVAEPTKYCNGTCQNSAQVCSSAADCVACNAACLTAEPRVVVNSLSSGLTPATNLPAPTINSVVTAPVGVDTTLSFVVDDANLVNPATAPYIFTSSVPSYGRVTAQADCTGACVYVGNFQKPQYIQVVLRPTTADLGTQQVVCVGANSLGNPLPSQYCVTIDVANNAVCGNGVTEAGEACDGEVCCTSTCTFASASTVCRAAAGACDVADTCSGSSAACTADVVAASTVVCRASVGVCDVADKCDGTSKTCGTDVFAASTTVCRAAANSCDIAEKCTGSSNACPADALSMSGPCFCARQNGGSTPAYSTYYCASQNATSMYQCYNGSGNNMKCATGTVCGCPNNVECGCSGTRNPCISKGTVAGPC